MATLLLSAAGAAIGASFGSATVLGLTGAVVGRAIGATLGRVIDQKILGIGSEAIEIGRVDRFRLMGASEGAAIPQTWGRVRVAGQVIWSSRFQENFRSSGGGKGGSRKVKEYSYTVSLAIALCQGEIRRVGRIWADGNEIEPGKLNLRVYQGRESQLPDPKIQAVEGADRAPAYRGIAYVVIEDLNLSDYGNRVPQFSFELVSRAEQEASSLSRVVPGVCLIPGTGEYALATTPVNYSLGISRKRSANVNSISGKTDFATSLEQLTEEMETCGMVSLVVSWFAGDLRCGNCEIKPKVEQSDNDGEGMPWRVSGLHRTAAEILARREGRSIYGGTPTDRSVIEAIQAIRAAGKKVTFYPFILMEQMAGNTLHDPWSGAAGQPALPWRGRITLNDAPGRPGSADGTAAAEAEVAGFFGVAQPADFSAAANTIMFSGPADWGFRRFILHYAHLCAAAGGVDAFCIGSELRGMTQIRGAGNSFPTVAALRLLAAEVKLILGPTTKITYAADWSEYFGYHVGNDIFFHLDPLWSDPAIDFIGIDNYMPLSDWRDGLAHADAAWGTVHNEEYLRHNIAGGEGYDWFYASDLDARLQNRTTIVDAAHGEDWIYRYKDLKGWWSSSHHNRIAGVRSAVPTAWVAGSKPFRFTEFGCAAVDKATNQPNLFVDLNSSESGLPAYSNGGRDDLIQMRYFQAMQKYWTDPSNNPTANLYAGTMVDFSNCTAWAWDARPFPNFPAHLELWSDGNNFQTGHWLNGRSANVELGAVVAQICASSEVADVDVKDAQAIVRGYAVAELASARSMLQPLMTAYAVDAVEQEGTVVFRSRTGKALMDLDPQGFAMNPDYQGPIERTRGAEVETPGKLRVSFLEAEANFEVTSVSAGLPDGRDPGAMQTDLPLVLLAGEARGIAERWMAETTASRETARFSLPPSLLGLGAGQNVQLGTEVFRIDRVEKAEAQMLEAVRIEPRAYGAPIVSGRTGTWQPIVSSVPVFPMMLDIPRLRDADSDQAPYALVAANPWPGEVAVWDAPSDANYSLSRIFDRPATLGVTESELATANAATWDRGRPLRVRLEAGSLESATALSVLAGANTALIGDGGLKNWEIIQFQTATLVAPGVYEITTRLRGQAGTNGTAPAAWPVGSLFVVIDEAVRQIDVPASFRGLERFYRFAPADRGYDAATSVLLTRSFDLVGLRPYSVAHLKAQAGIGGDLDVDWVRRTRIDGDSWQSSEVPLGEDAEKYRVQVRMGGVLKHDTVVYSPHWTYSLSQRLLDGASGSLAVSVAQVSQKFGEGPFRTTMADV